MSVVGRVALVSLPPAAVVAVRVVGGGLAFLAITRVSRRVPLDRADLPRLFVCAILGVVVNQEFFLGGLAHTTATNASVIGATIPIFASLTAIAVGTERFRALRAAGIALGVCGIFVLLRVERMTLGGGHAFGNLLILINAASYGLFLVVVRPLTAKYPPMMLIAMIFALAAIIVVPVGIPAWLELAPRLGAREALYLGYFVLVPTVGAYALNQIAMQRAEASLVAIYIYLQPVIATSGAIVFLGERPGPRTAVGAALILGGLVLGTRDSARRS